jgi:type II secretory pathway pseudopilin PulG
LTLVEALLSIVLVATMLVAMLRTFSAIARGQLLLASRSSATCLGNQLISEILQNQYQDPNNPVFGLEAGESNVSRASINDVDDYNGWVDSPPKWGDGNVIPGLTGWKRTVAVAYVDPNTLNPCGTDAGLKRITVTVTDPQGRAVSMTALRSSKGTYDQKPDTPTTCVRWVGVELQVGSDRASRVYAGANVLNLVPG